ncbi:MAG: hypothetical protein A3I29_00195 [Candidatus Magasanikbacteria bacterium RIFCSPLOWO2_02_FULL_44_11]|uniref:Uncharacterized protein n=2 Tax=Candidatus Magasanikiibacteriota TaxID=1752731 RepID=A0A1F6NAP5_9BACT|nr:MAG: hypothetical protein A3D53_01935 [Candidatus Magasanikbacteria bacterium RIFCSPHIGHO2_02_FULL_45_10]OGH80984.1 MAG: hypothetical protein A3I29_00195 [Candidatus Magasanikbacteria bacterium RIFCSPLOWO2_02_FULL_44_11]
MKHKLVETINRSWKNIVKHRKAVLMVGFFVLACGVAWHFFGASAALATEHENNISNPSILTTWIVKILLAIARLFLSLTMFIMAFIIQVAGYNGYLDSAAVNVGWVMVRDITNMGFVVILLVIAFGTILGLEHYEWKKMLVKLVIAAVIVNFSRTICGIFIDIAQVVMVTFVNGIAATAGGNLIQMFNLDKIHDLSQNTESSSFDGTNYLVAGMTALFFSAIVMSVMAVFLIMLVARMVVLWVLIVLSPLAFVLSILPQTEKYAAQWWDEFGKNVITGPVLLFFVWLAFVTAGNGKINEEIARPENNITDNATLGGEADKLAGQSSGIGAAMDWNSMANFAIAIGMLMVGARAASSIGGVGGDWAGKAVDFGKKVGMYAGGIYAARYLGKAAIEKAPVVGIDAWKRRGRTIKAMARTGLGKFNEFRDANLKDLEEGAGKVKGVKGFAARTGSSALSWMFESGVRKEKRVKDWEDAAEYQETIANKAASTSKSFGGKLKLDLRVRAHNAEEWAKAKALEKGVQKEQELMDKADAGHGKKRGIFSNRFRDRFGDREKGIFEAQAETENAEISIKRKKEIEVANERDRVLIKQGSTPRYVENVTARHTKEDVELAGSSNFDRTMGKMEHLRDNIRALNSKSILSPLSSDDDKKLINMRQDLASLMAFNGSRGAQFSDGGTSRATVNIANDVEADSVYGQLSNELAALLQRKVGDNETDIKAALGELKTQMGDKYTAFMRSWIAGLDNAAEDGSVNKAGLIIEKTNNATGEADFRVAHVVTDKDWTKNKRDWAISQSSAREISGFGGSIDRDKTGKISIKSRGAIDNVARMFGSVTENMVQSIKNETVKTFSEAFDNMDQSQIQNMLDEMFKTAKDPNGIIALMKRTNILDRANRIASTTGGKLGSIKFKVGSMDIVK